MAATSPIQVTATVPAGIDIANKIVIPATVEISLSGKQQVEWYCTDMTKTATVRFPATNNPFSKNDFLVPVGCGCFSGLVKPSVAVGSTYTYEVHVNGQPLALKHQVIIIIRP